MWGGKATPQACFAPEEPSYMSVVEDMSRLAYELKKLAPTVTTDTQVFPSGCRGKSPIGVPPSPAF